MEIGISFEEWQGISQEPNPDSQRCTCLLFVSSLQSLLYNGIIRRQFFFWNHHKQHLRLFPWHVHVPPEAQQKMYFHLEKPLLGCLHLIRSITSKIWTLLPETGNFVPRNTFSVPEKGECPDVKIAWIWCDRCEFLSSLTCGQGSIVKELFKYLCIFPGAVSWAVCTPMDVVKSRIQADGVYLNQYKGTLDCMLQSYQKEGLKVSGIWS